MSRVTRRDVALKAGVSETIVSYVMNHNRYVDKAKKEAVEKAVAELGYHPSPLARALKGKNTGHILFIADDLLGEYFGAIISEMEKVASESGICISLTSDKMEKSILDAIQTWAFSGIVIGSALMKESLVQKFIDSGIPVVVLEMRGLPHLKGRYGLINSGLLSGTEEAVRAIAAKGREEIVFIDSLAPDGRPVHDDDFRYRGYCAVVKDKARVIDGVKTEEELRLRVKMAYLEKPFDGAFCRTDSIAAVSLAALHDLHVRVPEDMSLMGCNDSRICRYLYPELASIHIKKDEIGKEAMRLLLELQNTKGSSDDPLVSRLTTYLVTRASL